MSCMLEREKYADYLASAIREESPWIIEMRAGASLLATREYEVDGKIVRSGFIVNLTPSPDRPRVGRVDPLVLIEDGGDWRVVDSLWTLGRLAGGSTASAFAQNPIIMLDASSGTAIIRRMLPRIKELASISSEYPEILTKASDNSSVIGEKPLEEIHSILSNLIPYLYDMNVDIRGKINILLGSWGVEEFRKQFSLSLEAIRVIEDEAQSTYDNLSQLVRVDEFVALREEEFSLVGDRAEITQRISLGWIFYSLGRRPTGEAYTKEFYNELGKRDLDEWIDPEDMSRWKEVMIKAINEILRKWIEERANKLSEEPELDSRSSTLERMVRGFSEEEERKVSGSLERFF